MNLPIIAVPTFLSMILFALPALAQETRQKETSDTIAAVEPPPARDGLVRIVSANFTLGRIVSQLNEQTTATVRVRGRMHDRKVKSFIARDMPLREALNQLVGVLPEGLIYEPSDEQNIFEIWDTDSFKREILPKLVRQKMFTPQHILAEEAHKAIQGVLTPHIGTASFDPRSNKVFLTDLPPVLELAQRILEQIDVGLITRVFYIGHADVQDLADKLSRLKGPAAPEPMADTRTRQIIVKDRLDRIREMELLVETLDIGGVGGASGTPVHGWKVIGRKGDQIKVAAPKGTPMTIRKGESLRFDSMPGNKHAQGKVTLQYLSEPDTTLPGRVAVFRVERDPVEVTLPIPEERAE